jgi:hypothetical protein
MSRHIYGDSNVVRYLPKVKESTSDPAIQSVTFTKTTNSVLLQDSLCNPKNSSTLIIIAAITNLLTAKFFEDLDALMDHCKNTFKDVLLWVQEGRNNADGFASLVCLFRLCEQLCLGLAFALKKI